MKIVLTPPPPVLTHQNTAQFAGFQFQTLKAVWCQTTVRTISRPDFLLIPNELYAMVMGVVFFCQGFLFFFNPRAWKSTLYKILHYYYYLKYYYYYITVSYIYES